MSCCSRITSEIAGFTNELNRNQQWEVRCVESNRIESFPFLASCPSLAGGGDVCGRATDWHSFPCDTPGHLSQGGLPYVWLSSAAGPGGYSYVAIVIQLCRVTSNLTAVCRFLVVTLLMCSNNISALLLQQNYIYLPNGGMPGRANAHQSWLVSCKSV